MREIMRRSRPRVFDGQRAVELSGHATTFRMKGRRMHSFRISLAGARGAVCGLVATLGLTASAGAAVIFTAADTLNPPREQVLFNDPGLTLSGPTIGGRTNDTQSLILFEGDEDLVATAAGQARIEAGDGGFKTLTIRPGGGVSFDGLGFNLFANEDGEVTLTAHLLGGATISESFAVSRNGQNRLVTLANDGDRLERVSFTTTVDMGDIRQVRISGVPEPTTAGLAGAAVGGLLLRRRR